MIREVVHGPIAQYTAAGPDRVDQCKLLGYRIITAAVIHFTSFLFPSHLLRCSHYSRPPSSITQIRGHIAGPLPPPHYGTCLNFYREKNSALSSLVDSRRIVPTHAARRFQQLVNPFFSHFFLQIIKPTKLTTRWLFNSRTNASINSVTPLDHRGDRLYITHCPGGVSGCILEPGIDQFREFESPRVRTRIIFRGTFSCALIDLRKARESELATLDEKSTISGC